MGKNLNPKWTPEDVHDFMVFDREQKMLIDVFDDDWGKTDDHIGCAEPLRVGESVEQSGAPLVLRDPKTQKTDCGSLVLKMELLEIIPQSLGVCGVVVVIAIERIELPLACGSEVAICAKVGTIEKTTPLAKCPAP